MTEQKNTVVGILRLDQMTVCIQALEKFEKETQAIVDQTPDSALDDEWEKQHALAVSARGALGMFRLIVGRAKQINENPGTAYTIHWQGDLGKALKVMGVPSRAEWQEREQTGEWDG